MSPRACGNASAVVHILGSHRHVVDLSCAVSMLSGNLEVVLLGLRQLDFLGLQVGLHRLVPNAQDEKIESRG